VTSPPISEASAVCSAAADRNVDEAGFAADYANRSARHDVAFGGFVRTTNVGARYATILTGSQTPIAGDPLRTGHRQAAYAQDQWQLGKLTFEPGLRLDTEQISGTDASGDFAQPSPRLKVTQNFTARANVYAYYGRLFTPFPLDTLILPTLRPQRDSLYEFGGQAPLGAFDLGLRIMHKRSDDVIDDARLATTNIRESVSFADGITDLQSLLVQRRTKTGGRDFVTLTHGRATVRGCTTSILVSCFAPNWIAADADQRWSATAGQYIPLKSSWLSWTGEYGSGRKADGGAAHLTFDLTVGRKLPNGLALTVTLANLLNDRFAITSEGLDGAHYARPRSLQLTIGDRRMNCGIPKRTPSETSISTGLLVSRGVNISIKYASTPASRSGASIAT